MRTFSWLQTFGQDLRYAARGLRKNPGFVSIVVLSLALGIGANSTIFSVMNALLYRPLPYEHADRLVVIWEMQLSHPDSWQPPPIAELLDWKSQNHVFEDIALTSSTEPAVMSGRGGPQPIRVQDATPNFFRLLGAKPVLGRIFAAEEMQDQTQTVLISTSFWKTHFDGDPGVLGKTFNVGGVISTVVGVMPRGFAPFYGGTIDVWQPINPASPRYTERQDHWLMPVARLKPGVTLEQAKNEMKVIASRLELAYPATNKGIGKKLVPLHEELFGWARQPMYPLLGAVAFVLLIACANVANLLQSRTESRRNEYAVRASLGADRRRLIQQLLAESGVLALAGGLLGVALTYFGIQLFLKLAGDFPNADSINIDARVLLFTLVVSLLTAFVFGLAPAVQASNPNLNNALREGARRTSAGSRGFTRHALAVSEVALAMVLLTGAGLMINSILHLQRVNPGFEVANLLTMRIQLPEAGKYVQRVPGGDMERATPQVTAFYQRLLEKTAALPGVESVGSMTGLPTHFAEGYSFSILGHPAPPPDQRPQAGYTQATAGIFRTLKIPLKKGRLLDEHDTLAAPWVVVVNETFAHRYFPNEDPIGQQILVRYDPYPVDEERPRRIVGIVGDTKQYGMGQPTPPFIYSSYLQQPTVYPGGAIVAHLWQELALRTAPEARPEGLATAVKKIVGQIDADQPVTNVMTMEQALAESMGDYQFYMQVLGIFASIAVLLAVMGIYGVMSYFVSQRTREIGIRVALGARSADVLSLVATMGLKLATIGVVIGFALAFGLTRLIATFLFGVKPTDPVTYAIVAAVLIAVALLASYIPARRATKVDPMTALRYE
ncbi:MAG TPA: ABC transporter permease [Candidatus Acidoferrum sp.]|nr:ABC transporter permease [Candidatus Acidoferrum sp.]